MKDEYIIINKKTIQKRIEDLRQVCNKELGYASDKIYFELEHLLSQSTPLIPEIEKAFDAGSENPRIGGSYPMFEMEKEQNNAKQFYILNLKLDI